MQNKILNRLTWLSSLHAIFSNNYKITCSIVYNHKVHLKHQNMKYKILNTITHQCDYHTMLPPNKTTLDLYFIFLSYFPMSTLALPYVFNFTILINKNKRSFHFYASTPCLSITRHIAHRSVAGS